jgi:hypothetical protein
LTRTYGPVEFTLEADHVAAFARAVDADPAQGVPPAYAAVYALATTAPLLFADPEAKVDYAHLVHAEQEFEWERPPNVGETVSAKGRVTSDSERRGMRFLGFEADCSDAEGRPLCRSKSLFIIRSSTDPT